MDLEKFRSLSLLDVVYSRVKDDILTGKYKPGERLIVKKMSEDLGVSHTPINESLNRLVTEGYVEFVPRKGMKVREIDVKEIAETYEIRLMIEIFCAEDTIARAREDSAYVEELRRLADAMSEGGYARACEDGFAAFFENEAQFHRLQVSACKNKKMIGLYENLKANTMFYNRMVLSHMILTEARYIASVREHAGIVYAIIQSSTDLLKAGLCEHIRNTIDYTTDPSGNSRAG